MPERFPGLSARLDALRVAEDLRVAPLWIEALAPREGLAAVRGLDHPLAKRQAAWFIARLGGCAEDDRLSGEEPSASGSTRADGEPPEEGEDRFPPVAGELATRTLGELYLAQGDRVRAVEMFRAVLAREPGDETARTRLAELTGAEHDSPCGGLTRWLDTVREWRDTLGV